MLSRDAFFHVALELDDINAILNLCKTSKILNQYICNNNNFWIQKLKRKYPEEVFNVLADWDNDHLLNRITPKDFYLGFSTQPKEDYLPNDLGLNKVYILPILFDNDRIKLYGVFLGNADKLPLFKTAFIYSDTLNRNKYLQDTNSLKIKYNGATIKMGIYKINILLE